MATPPAAPQTLIWVQTAFLGDLVLTTGAMRLVDQHFPGCEQILLTHPLGATALAGVRALATVFTLDKRGGGFWRDWHRVRQAIRARVSGRSNCFVLQPHQSWRSSCVSHSLGLPVITYRGTPLAFWARARVDRVAVLHESVRIALLLEPLGIARTALASAPPALAPLPAARRCGRQRVVLAPGSVWATKRWPYFAALLRGLLHWKHAPVQVILIGSATERDLATQVIADAAIRPELQAQVDNRVGQTSIQELAAIIAGADLLVTNDSAPIHYASAYGVPTLAIFGATTPAMGFGPLAPRQEVLEQHELPCRPCSVHGPRECPLGHFACMQEISADRAVAAAARLLAPSMGTV